MMASTSSSSSSSATVSSPLSNPLWYVFPSLKPKIENFIQKVKKDEQSWIAVLQQAMEFVETLKMEGSDKKSLVLIILTNVFGDAKEVETIISASSELIDLICFATKGLIAVNQKIEKSCGCGGQ